MEYSKWLSGKQFVVISCLLWKKKDGKKMDTCTQYIADKLPIVYDVAMAIHSVAPGAYKKGREDAIHRYSLSLHEMWVKAFGAEHVTTLTSIKNRIVNIMKDYDNKCYKASFKRRSNDSSVKPLRVLNKIWRFQEMPQKKNTPKSKRQRFTNNDLFDVGKDMEKLKGDEDAFYKDQRTVRIGRLSEKIDVEHEEEQERKEEEEARERSLMNEEESFTNPPEFQEMILNMKDRSIEGRKIVMVDQGIQCDDINIIPEIRMKRNTFPRVKDAIATVSYRAGISVAKARIATKAVAEKMYGHHYALEVQKSSVLETIDETAEEPVSKKPRTKDDYEKYKYVLPSNKSINTYKHMKALVQEIDAANALRNKDKDTKVTLHYDTTSRSRIPGEWPGLILNFLNKNPSLCKMFTLRALTFAYEDRNQIAKLVLETFERLATATNGSSSAKDLWENVTAFMTDAVSKNLKVEYLVAEKLGSEHVPYHLLCKAHTCEKLDECNEITLVKIEEQLKIRETIEKREPRLKSFIRKSKSVTKAAMAALLQLVSRGGDGKSTSLCDDFTQILEEDGAYRTFSLYKERRFTKLGYTAGALYDCLPHFNKLLERTHLNNLLVKACRLYLESDYITVSLKALSNFTYRVTMPYLNAVERVDQNELIKILPQLCNDLKNGSPGKSLDSFHVEWTHVKMKDQVVTSELDKFIQKEMCITAGKGVELQCAREYWAESDNPRATQLFKLTA